MTDQMRTKVIGASLVVAIIWAGFNLRSDNSQTTPETLQTIQPIELGTKNTTKAKINIDIKKYEMQSWGRSPFYLSSLNTVNKPQIIHKNNKQTLSWILSGIMLNNSSSIAIINKRPVKIGETIDNAIVTKIEKEEVIIKYKQKEITLTVSKG